MTAAAAAAAVHKTRKNANRPSGAAQQRSDEAAQQRSDGAAEQRSDVMKCIPNDTFHFHFHFHFHFKSSRVSMRSYNSH
jgi:hypothetical protein